MRDNRKLCFVVMGFGKKTDFETGRTLDLDATYEGIIQPAVEAIGLRCIRADEVMHSGIIDTEMYEMLLRADLVIADISTGNVNAIYELGVRHALRPNSTLVMKEDKGRLYFDLDHVSTFQYQHLGEDIGAREAVRASRELRSLIEEVLVAQQPDSPVYTYLPKLQQPQLTDDEFAELLDEKEAEQERLSSYMRAGETAREDSRHGDAVTAYMAADQLKPNDPFIIQQLALVTYKSKQPSEFSALVNGLQIISVLHPENSNDPETRGITGAMHKRLWLLTGDKAQLDAAILHYGRGFEFRRDYYNGENLAACYDFRSSLQTDPDEAKYDRMSARKVREVILTELDEALAQPSFEERPDRRWVYASLANCSYGIGKVESGEGFEKKFRNEKPAQWEVETFELGKQHALSVC
ncbi:tetratricopeptide repeat-containing protein [Halomonas sp. M4R1S46]|uniref:tetratricopeptide repeat-containing protein n=1 Tax=Halomonas sp. M4R1S46 TaxID=2982692 RepID=UPI0021E46D98|nr:tetratricopeptide repeat-containing protein [Halomonas sp. M4R1S46]UYG07160.1 hypothetical protein OCT48_16235 [Halomonas sp. M4R1S46]